jgi:hypothetical protein
MAKESPTQEVAKYLNLFLKAVKIEPCSYKRDDEYAVDDLPGMIEIDGYTLSPFEKDFVYKTIGGERTRKGIAWVLTKTVLIPGVRYYKDGSGQPDDYDYIEVGTYAHPAIAARALVEQLLRDMLDGASEAEWEREMDEGLDKMCDEWESEFRGE